MYKIKCDDFTLYNPSFNDLVVGDPNLNLEVNKAGSLSFSIYPTHKYFNSIKKMESIIQVYQDNKILFKGRVYSDTVNFYKIKKVEVEGILAYFNDSIVRPYEYTGNVEEYLTFLINQHNEQVEEFQRFKLGNVTVEDPNEYIARANSSMPNTWAEIEEKLIKILGGYICIRYEADGNYIDYLADYSDISTQEIRFKVNLLDLENVVKGDTLATCIIPYGAKLSDINNAEEDTPEDETPEEEIPEEEIEPIEDETPEDTTTEEEDTTSNDEERLSIKDVNNGLDYIQNDEAVAKYGRIYEVVTWEDVTDANNLLTKARAYLNNAINLTGSLTIKAIDLHLNNKDIEAFKLGDYIKVYSSPHGIDETLLLKSYSLPLADPSGFTFTLGVESSSFMDSQINTERESANNVHRIDIIDKQVGDLTKSVNESVNESLYFVNQAVETSEEFTRTLLEAYAKTSDLEELNETISLTFQQTAEEINYVFTTVTERITTENEELSRELEEISKYVRIVDGGIILGEVGNALTTKIANGRISFLYNDTDEVAYLSENKLYITNAEILTEIVIGKFAFKPRANGNLSFLKVRD